MAQSLRGVGGAFGARPRSVRISTYGAGGWRTGAGAGATGGSSPSRRRAARRRGGTEAVSGAERFTVRAADNSMTPRLRAGDYVRVDPDEPAVAGRVVLFGHGEAAVVRLLVEEDGRRVLRALREGYPEVVVDADNETDIRGVVVFSGREVSRGRPPSLSFGMRRRSEEQPDGNDLPKSGLRPTEPVQLAQPGFIRDGTWGVSVRRIESEEPSTRRKSGHEPAPFGTTWHKIDPYM